ncbi:hypothetical protein KQI63_03400 [bacterium]|nr:hypothetical protein [bacterium]
MTASHRTLLPLAALLLILAAIGLLVGCSGDDGPAGPAGSIPDNVPPTIVLVEPTAGDTLSDTLRVTANAVDNVGLRRVVFYLDGSDVDNDTGYVHLTEEPYRFTFDLVGRGMEDGPHTLMGRAYDLAGNVTDTPPMIIYTKRIITAGEAVLSHYSDSDSMMVYSFPKRHESDGSFEVDSLWTRFTMERSGTVTSVEVYLDSLETETMNYDTLLTVAIYQSNGVYPTSEVASGQINTEGLEFTGFHTLPVPFTDPPAFAAGDKFHVLMTVDGPTDTTRFGVRTAVIDRYPFATDSRSGVWFDNLLQPPHWETMQEQQGGVYTKEFLIRAIVDYE